MAKYYDKKELFMKALKIYTSSKLFMDFIETAKLFPLEIKLKRIKQSDIQSSFSTIRDELNLLQKEGLELSYKEFNFKTIGMQKLPLYVVFEDRDMLLDFIKKSDEFAQFVKDYEMIILKYPSLKELLYLKPFLVIDYHNVWSKLFSVCDFFIANSHPNIYIRELSIKDIDTKFIEKYKKILDKLLTILLDNNSIDADILTLSNYGFEKKYHLKYSLPTVRFRILDSSQTIAGLSDISLNIEEFKHLNPTCRYVFIVENKITTLSFPPLENSMVIFGNGYGVEVLKDVEWLKTKDIFYWGDIDSDGFAILSQVRGYFKNTVSILMDKQTKDRFEHFGVEVKTAPSKELKNLTDKENNMFKNIGNFRLEQERIGFEYVKNSLANRL